MLIDQLRKEIFDALLYFQNIYPELSNKRLQDINQIKEIIRCHDPLIVKNKLLDYLKNLPSGWFGWLPFSEIYCLKNTIYEILNFPKYQENTILKTMIEEM